jgi:TatD DNase family protein
MGLSAGMIDCHTHLTDAAFDPDRGAVLARARVAGVARIALVGQDAAENEAVLRAAAGEALFIPFLGLHPDRFADRLPPPDEGMVEAVAAQIRAHAGSICGIGEVGLDRWVCQASARREAQAWAFARLIELARELDLPLNVHSRSAGRHAIDLLLDKGARRVLMHAFDGKAGHALRGAEAGFLFSVPPSIVRSPQKQKLVRALPLESLALETDSPVLGPEPGTRNEPANLAFSARAIAELKGLSEEDVRRRTTENARRLFRLVA